MALKIEKLSLVSLRNEEHYQFNQETIALIIAQTATKLGIVTELANYQKYYALEGDAINVVRHSTITDELHAADTARDNVFNGIRDLVKSYSNHFKADMKAAATHLKVLFETYGNITQRNINESSGAYTSFIADLRGTYLNDVKIIGLTDWVAELEAKNQAYVTLKNTRYTEQANRPQVNMKSVRADVDTAYRTIAEKVNAQVIVNGEANYKAFILELNQRVEKYNTIIAQRKGRTGKDDGGDSKKIGE